MADYQRVVEYLRDIRSMQNPPITDELKQHAQEFANLCVQVNERLRKRSALLQQGLRSEAIHLAEDSPNLLDLVAALDLPDPQVWVEFCQATDMPVAPPLQLDRAAQLNEAYAIDQPMEHLLGQHRLLALQRAAVGERLAVMRQLAAQDPGSGFWEKDIRVFERVRIRELPSAFSDAMRRRDDAAIGALVDEIESQPWYESVPADLRSAVNDAFARIHRAQLEKELRRQLDAMHEAFAARNLDQAIALLARWNETIKAAGAPNISTDIIQQASPIAAWIEQENQAAQRIKAFKNATGALAQLLDQDASDAELDGALAQVKSFDDQPVPEALMERLREVRARRAAAKRSQHKLKLSMMAAAACVVLLIAGVGLFYVLRARSAAAWASKINIARDSGQVEQVRKVLADLDREAPQLKNEGDVAKALQEALTFIHSFDNHKDDIASIKKQLDDWNAEYTVVRDNKAAGEEELLNKAKAFDSQIRALPAYSTLKDADTDGSLQVRLSQATTILETIQEHGRKLVLAKVNTLTNDLKTVQGGAQLSPDDAATVERVEGEAIRLAGLPSLDKETKASAETLLAAAKDKRGTSDQNVAMQQDLDGLLQKTATIEGYKAALDAFAENYGTLAPARAADFKKASDALAPLKTLDSWRAKLAEAGVEHPAGLTPHTQAAAQKLAEAVAGYLKDNPQSAIAKQLQDYTAYLTAAAASLQEKGALQDAFGEQMAESYISKMTYVEDSTNKKYYFVKEPVFTPGNVNGKPSTHFEMMDPGNRTRTKPQDIYSPNHLKDPKPQLVPHAQLANSIDAKTRAVDDANWDTTAFDVIDEIAAAGPDVDPVIKVNLLLTALNAAKTIDPSIGDVYEKTILSLKRLDVGILPAMLAAAPTQPVLEQINKILKEMPKGADVKAAYLASRDGMLGAIMLDMSSTGYLGKKEGVPVILTRTPASNGAVARGAASDGLKKVAHMENGQWKMEESAATLPEGTLLLITP